MILGCQALFGLERGAEIQTMVESALGAPCPCSTGQPCPLLPRLPEPRQELEVVVLDSA